MSRLVQGFAAAVAVLVVMAPVVSSAASQDTVNLTLGYATGPYRVNTGQPFRTIRIGDPKVLDVRALTNRRVMFQPLKAGATNVLFLDKDNNILKELSVFVSEGSLGRVQILTPGPRHALASVYRCGKDGCEFVREDVLQLPEPMYRNINKRGNAGTASGSGGNGNNQAIW